MDDEYETGKWLVYEGIMHDHWIAREILGTTPGSILLQPAIPPGHETMLTPDEIRPRRIMRRTMNRQLHRVVADQETAEALAKAITDEFKALNAQYRISRVGILNKHLGTKE